jgi:DHA1 family tetracycline resistance protein-like MFS transporter
LFGLATVTFLGYVAHVVLPSTAVLYLGYRYGWGPSAVGLTLAAVGLCAMIVQGTLVKPIAARFGERRALLAGLLCGATGFAIYGLLSTGTIYYLGIPIMAFWDWPVRRRRRCDPPGARQSRANSRPIASLMGIAGLIGQSSLRNVRPVHWPRRRWHSGAPFLWHRSCC